MSVTSRMTGFVKMPEGKLFWRYDAPAERKAPTGPFLLFAHAAVADHTLWDEQVRHLTQRGWDCLRYDRLGFGHSVLSRSYLETTDRPPIQHYQHPNVIIAALEENHPHLLRRRGRKCVVIGLSMGAYTALDFAFAFSSRIAGLVLCSGGVSGFVEPEQPPSDKELFRRYESLIEKARYGKGSEADLIEAADTQVRIWGDGLQAKKGRLQNDAVRTKLFLWCQKIAADEAQSVGGAVMPCGELQDPPAVERVKTMRAEVSVKVGIGKYDETGTNEAMKYLHNQINVRNNWKDVELMEFEAAHMCNMECPTEFNNWVDVFLESLDDHPK